ncbi:MgtC/SapB family protein [Archangium violaceum]|uniref:MgtC/SapB family protein n=1 Tax=Archangium violaceum TaxID=83451 RepID=UPI00193C5A9F|nr:MgtC/SapB family protein [Archangium violaceum]QRK12382.1 MgtC/SapB family protein [Archangium violaceum]
MTRPPWSAGCWSRTPRAPPRAPTERDRHAPTPTHGEQTVEVLSGRGGHGHLRALPLLGLALAAGFLIGQEREYSAPDPREGRESFLGGSRTYPLVSLAGAASVLVARQFGPWLMLLSLAALGALLVVSYAGDVRQGRSHGLSSEVSLLLSYLLGRSR